LITFIHKKFYFHLIFLTTKNLSKKLVYTIVFVGKII
jgi:hypothetical protein